MRLLKGFAIGSMAVGLAGCTGVASQSSPAGGTTAPAGVTNTAPAGVTNTATAGAKGSAPSVVKSTAPAAAPVSSQFRAGAQATAARFYRLYSAGQFSDAWNLLSPAAKRQVSKTAWVGVHNACPGVAVGKPRVIKAVTAFGSAAIVTEVVSGTTSGQATAEDVFNYAGGTWNYSPGEVSIYLHGSVAADVASAKTAGFCTGWKVF